MDNPLRKLDPHVAKTALGSFIGALAAFTAISVLGVLKGWLNEPVFWLALWAITASVGALWAIGFAAVYRKKADDTLTALHAEQGRSSKAEIALRDASGAPDALRQLLRRGEVPSWVLINCTPAEIQAAERVAQEVGGELRKLSEADAAKSALLRRAFDREEGGPNSAA